MDKPSHLKGTHFLREGTFSLTDFRAVTEIEARRDAVPHAEEIAKDIPAYEADRICGLGSEPGGRHAILIERASVCLAVLELPTAMTVSHRST